jgi:hypothetical protein
MLSRYSSDSHEDGIRVTVWKQKLAPDCSNPSSSRVLQASVTAQAMIVFPVTAELLIQDMRVFSAIAANKSHISDQGVR